MNNPISLAISTPISFDSETHEIMALLGVSTLEEFINFMNDAHDACIHSCDYMNDRDFRHESRDKEIWGDIIETRNQWKSDWLDFMSILTEEGSLI